MGMDTQKLNELIDYKKKCNELMNEYKQKHFEFLKFSLLIQSLFNIYKQLDDYVPFDLSDLDDWDVDNIDDLKKKQQEINNKILDLKKQFDSIKSEPDPSWYQIGEKIKSNKDTSSDTANDDSDENKPWYQIGEKIKDSSESANSSDTANDGSDEHKPWYKLDEKIKDNSKD